VISDKFLELIPWSFLRLKAELEVEVEDRSELESDVDAEVIGSQACEGAPFTCGG